MTTTGITPSDRLVVAEAAGKRGREQASDGASDSGEFDGLLALLSRDGAPDQQKATAGEGSTTARGPFVAWQDRIESVVALTNSADGNGSGPLSPDGLKIAPADAGETGDISAVSERALDLLASLGAAEIEGEGDDQTELDPPPLEKQTDGLAVSDAVTTMLLIAGAGKQAAQSSEMKLPGAMASSAVSKSAGAMGAPTAESTAQTLQGASDGSDAIQMPSAEMDDVFASLSRDADPGSTAGAAEAKFTVLRTETHLAPALQQLPIIQVAERIGEALSTAADIELLRTDPASPGTKLVPDGPTKVLLIQLQPADLGTVTARMSLKNDALEVRLEVSRHETAERIRQDREVLSRILQSAGYAVDNVTVHVVDVDRSMTALQHNTSHATNGASQMPSQTQAGWSQSDGRAAGGRSDQPDHGGGEASNGHDAGMENTQQGSRSANSGLYL